MSEAQQHSRSGVNGSTTTKRDELAEKWRRAAAKILETVERGNIADLENENPEDFVNTLTTAADWGLTFGEVSREDSPETCTPIAKVAVGLRRLHEARVTPHGWVISRFVGIVGGNKCKACSWKAERPGCGFILVSEEGDFDTGPGFEHPPLALLARDVRNALERLDGVGSKAVAS